MRCRLPRFVSSLPWAACALGGGLLGCIGGQTGGEETDRGSGGGQTGGPVLAEDSACKGTSEALDVDSVSPLGFSAAEVLSQLSGRHAAPLLWNDDTAPATLGPERGQSSLTLEILYGGGEVRFVKVADAGADPNGAAASAGLAPQCPLPRFEIDVVMRASTMGGALDEQFPGTLEASSATRAVFSESLRLDALSGTFSVSLPQGYSTSSVELSGSFDGDAFSGQLSGVVSSTGSNSDAVASRKALQIRYAEWPAPTAAPSP